jgi:hypothetical protein
VNAVIRNIGTGTLDVSGTQLLGLDRAQFAVLSGGGSFSLAQGEVREMRLRFSPTAVGRTNGRVGFHYNGVASPAVLELFGEGLDVQGSGRLKLDTIRARVGEVVEVPLYLLDAHDIALTGATGFHTELLFNASLLAPVGNTPPGSTENGVRRIVLDNVPFLPDAQGIVATLHFIAMLGDAEGTPLRLEHSSVAGGKVTLAEIPGYFLLSNVCRAGGARLFLATATSSLAQNRPNPFNATTRIEYEVIERAPSRLAVLDRLGRTVAILLDGVVEPGRYTMVFDASTLASGTYLLILHTPTTRLCRLMEVMK